MLLARLVTGRYGYLGEDQPRPSLAPAAEHSWLARLVAAVFPRKKG